MYIYTWDIIIVDAMRFYIHQIYYTKWATILNLLYEHYYMAITHPLIYYIVFIYKQIETLAFRKKIREKSLRDNKSALYIYICTWSACITHTATSQFPGYCCVQETLSLLMWGKKKNSRAQPTTTTNEKNKKMKPGAPRWCSWRAQN